MASLEMKLDGSAVTDALSHANDDALRDYFAGQVISQCQITVTREDPPPDSEVVAIYAERFARTAYVIADAMLKARRPPACPDPPTGEPSRCGGCNHAKHESGHCPAPCVCDHEGLNPIVLLEAQVRPELSGTRDIGFWGRACSRLERQLAAERTDSQALRERIAALVAAWRKTSDERDDSEPLAMEPYDQGYLHGQVNQLDECAAALALTNGGKP